MRRTGQISALVSQQKFKITFKIIDKNGSGKIFIMGSDLLPGILIIGGSQNPQKSTHLKMAAQCYK